MSLFLCSKHVSVSVPTLATQVRAVKRGEGDVQVTRAKPQGELSPQLAAIAEQALNASKLLTDSAEPAADPTAGGGGGEAGGGGALSVEGRAALYRRLGFFREEGENEVRLAPQQGAAGRVLCCTCALNGHVHQNTAKTCLILC